MPQALLRCRIVLNDSSSSSIPMIHSSWFIARTIVSSSQSSDKSCSVHRKGRSLLVADLFALATYRYAREASSPHTQELIPYTCVSCTRAYILYIWLLCSFRLLFPLFSFNLWFHPATHGMAVRTVICKGHVFVYIQPGQALRKIESRPDLFN